MSSFCWVLDSVAFIVEVGTSYKTFSFVGSISSFCGSGVTLPANKGLQKCLEISSQLKCRNFFIALSYCLNYVQFLIITKLHSFSLKKLCKPLPHLDCNNTVPNK